MNLFQKMRQTKEDVAAGRDRLVYGRAYVDFHDYVNELKFRATKPTIKEAIMMPGTTLSKAAGVSKAIKAAFDNSYIFRQGLKAAYRPATHKIWRKNALDSFGWMVKQFGGKPVMRELMADIVSRPNWINGKMEKAKLAFGNPEEPFPTSLPEKIWFFGKLYKASETAFAGQAYKNRADIFDKMLEMAEKSGHNISDKKDLMAIGKLVNSMTGRGDLGRYERVADTVNNVLFSARFLKSNFDLLTAHGLGFQKGMTPFTRQQAAKNLLSSVIGIAGVLSLAKALKPDSVEFDLRSANSGKIKFGNTRFDVTGGLGSLLTLAVRWITNSTKSATTGKITKGGESIISKDRMDYLYDFIEGKFSPAMQVATTLARWEDKATRKKPTVGGLITKAFAPMPLENLMELLKDKNSAPTAIALIMDGLGIGTNTYGVLSNQENAPASSGYNLTGFSSYKK
jgi:hypothetical protein